MDKLFQDVDDDLQWFKEIRLQLNELLKIVGAVDLIEMTDKQFVKTLEAFQQNPSVRADYLVNLGAISVVVLAVLCNLITVDSAHWNNWDL
jgi:hypothetical protein